MHLHLLDSANTMILLSLYTLPIGVNSLILLLSMTWLFFPSFLFPNLRVWHYTLFNIKKKKKKHFIATTACYISFSPFLPYLRAFCPPNSPPLFQIKAPFNYHQSTPTQPRSKIKLKNSSLILHISQLQIYKKEKKIQLQNWEKLLKVLI